MFVLTPCVKNVVMTSKETTTCVPDVCTLIAVWANFFQSSLLRFFFLAGPRKLNIPILYKLQKPKRATLRLQCALYETFFSKPRHPFLFSSTECFPIVQTRCHREKYVFDHTKNVRNTAFVYSCGGFLLFASFLFFPLHEDNLLRWTGIFAFACLGSTLYSLVKLD